MHRYIDLRDPSRMTVNGAQKIALLLTLDVLLSAREFGSGMRG
jgi:hypothetical protein